MKRIIKYGEALAAFCSAAICLMLMMQPFSAAASTYYVGSFCLDSTPPAIIQQPISATNSAGTSVNFTVTVQNTRPLSCLWLKDGEPLAESGRITGTTNASLIISTLQASDSGNYVLKLSNVAGTATSSVAVLVVVPPPIITSASITNGIINTAFNYQITASSSPKSFYAIGLPNGLSINNGTGLISGKPTSAGTFILTLSASNAVGIGSGALTLSVNPIGLVTTTNPYPMLSISGPAIVTRRMPFTLMGTDSGTARANILQWQRNFVPLWGVSDTNKTTLPVSGESTTGRVFYTLISSNRYGQNSVSTNITVVPAQRISPQGFWPGASAVIQLPCGPRAGVGNHAFTEQFSTNSTVEFVPDYLNGTGLPIGYHYSGRMVKLVAANISHNGVFDPVQCTIKWGPFFDDSPRILTYTLLVPLGWTNTITFSGALSEDGVNIALPNSALKLYPDHPADNNAPADNLITIFEVASYAAAWRKSLLWQVPPTSIPQDYVTQAGLIWKSGEYYTNGVGIPPQNWVPAPLPSGFVAGNTNAGPVSGVAGINGVTVRQLTPAIGSTNGALAVALSMTPATNISVCLIEEQVPHSWTVTNISAGGVWDQNFNKVKWGPVFSAQATVYSYTAIPPAGAIGIHVFGGLAGLDGTILNIGGQSEVVLGANPGTPYILTHPTGQTVNSGGMVAFGVVAGGAMPLTYQWRKNELDLPSQTNAVLTLSNVATGAKGNYDVVVSFGSGSVTSYLASLTVLTVTYNGMIVFGDSLSDTGRIPADSRYCNGRWSNGSLWCELMAPNVGCTFDPNQNYAAAGAQTADLATQVAQVSAVNGQLCAIWCGGNDFLNNMSVGEDDFIWNYIINSAVNNITSSMGTLYGKGGRNFLVLNLPDMGKIPTVLAQATPAYQSYLSQKTVQFNSALSSALAGLPSSYSGIVIKQADVFGRMNQLLANPAGFGFTVTTNGALDDINLLDKSLVGPGTNYLFWDGIHPTTKGHAQIATAAQLAVGIIGSPVTAPAVVQQPQAVTATPGARVIFGVGAAGSASLFYQWFKNGVAIPGAVAQTLTLNPVRFGDAGSYNVVVSNAVGKATSAAALLTVHLKATTQSLVFQPLQQQFNLGLIYSETNQGYWLEYRNSLNDSNWSVIGYTNRGTDGSLQFNDPSATNSNGRFYRLGTIPLP